MKPCRHYKSSHLKEEAKKKKKRRRKSDLINFVNQCSNMRFPNSFGCSLMGNRAHHKFDVISVITKKWIEIGVFKWRQWPHFTLQSGPVDLIIINFKPLNMSLRIPSNVFQAFLKHFTFHCAIINWFQENLNHLTCHWFQEILNHSTCHYASPQMYSKHF